MTMTIDNSQQRFGGGLNYDHMPPYSATQPQFTNPWVSSSSSAVPQSSTSHGMYGSNQQAMSLDTLKHHHQPQQPVSRTSTSSSASMGYGSIPVTSASAGSPLSMTHNAFGGQQDLLSMPQDILNMNRMPHHQTTSAAYPETGYTTSASPIHSNYAPSPTPYDSLGYAPAPMRSTFAAMAPEAEQRRYSQSSVRSLFSSSGSSDHDGLPPLQHRNSLIDFDDRRSLQHDDRRSFADAIEASHGILSLSQETPRPIYGSRTRGSGDSYGFPSHSSSSSVSSSTGFSGYYGGSVDSSVSDYSTAGSDIESVTSRTLPRPQGMMASQAPPAPQSMMGQFSSKVSSSTQKKHKCKVCDKRFTRPSSLQTHMYSHTGEKPFSCEVEGCGRHFSVVSNLRRHRKVHKGQAPSEAGSEDHHSD